MNIMLIFYGHGFAGGASFSLANLAVGLSAVEDYKVVAVVPCTKGHEMPDYLTSRGVDVIELPYATRTRPKHYANRKEELAAPFRDVGKKALTARAGRLISRELEARAIDVLHIGGAVIDLGAKEAFNLGIPVVWHLRECVDLDWDLAYYDEPRAFDGYRRASALIAVSDYIADYYARKDAGLAGKITTIYNGICSRSDVPVFECSLSGAGGAVFNLACFSGVRESKGAFEILEAAKLLVEGGFKGFKVQFFGRGTDADIAKLNGFVDEHNLRDYVEYLGWAKLTLADYTKFDAILVCSRSEAFGRVTAESMLAGTPVIGADAGGTAELLSGERGVLYSPGNAGDLASKIRWAAEQRGELANIADAAWGFASERFTNEAYVGAVRDAYQKILGAAR